MLKLKFIGSSLLIVLATAMLPHTATATVTTFFGSDGDAMGAIPSPSNAVVARANFTSALVSSIGESFESPSIVAGTTPTAANPLSIFSGNASLFRNDGTFGNAKIENEPFVEGVPTGRFNTSSPGAGKWWEASAAFSLNFSTATQALGFYGTDFGDFDGMLTLSFFSGLTAIDLDVAVPSSVGSNGSLLFFGYINSTAFDRVVFNIAQANPGDLGSYDILGFDDVIMGMANGTPPPPGVPEPGTLALVALSLGLLAARRRLR